MPVVNDALLRAVFEATKPKPLMFTLWDVGHGLSIWIKTPNGHNHWIDAGWYPDTNFCPAKHVREQYGETQLDFLIISHPDSDHVHNLPEIIEHLGVPRIFCRNPSLPADLKYGSATLDYQIAYKQLDEASCFPVLQATSPYNPDYNGGITVVTSYLDYTSGMSINDTSVVAMYAYAGWLFIMPGDLEASGWEGLWTLHSVAYKQLIDTATYRILVAPHHGRSSAYSQHMMDVIKPNLVLISDEYGQEPTDPRFRTNPLGIAFKGAQVKFFSTKTGGRMQFKIDGEGICTFDQQ